MAYGAILGQRDRVLSVADVSPDSSGNIPLTAADISAQDVLTEDLTLTASTLQKAINDIPSKNLGGHTVTIKVPLSFFANTSTIPCTINGFYNGIISIIPSSSRGAINGDIIIKNCCNCPIFFGGNITINGNQSNDAYGCVFEVRRSNIYMGSVEINGRGNKAQDGIRLLEGGTLSFTDGTINNCNNAINTQAASRSQTTGPVVTIYGDNSGTNNNIGLRIWSGICYCLSNITFSNTTTQYAKSGGLIVSSSGTLL